MMFFGLDSFVLVVSVRKIIYFLHDMTKCRNVFSVLNHVLKLRVSVFKSCSLMLLFNPVL